ncbi:hypothetical protein HOS78_gp092 [Lactobacillus phage Bacchae]|uniref:Uncharacterized protein n=1 Tax=Lactobacillus phage Bacchae TaxID=2079429 RepID=A0A2K9VCT3_9CAUD|nr:hypothetical protein HOS78_gp092 [Lactobacillus phage Bacchae]AUV60028.1 hypothetical protein [Lactobacillus phage Bacchae]
MYEYKYESLAVTIILSHVTSVYYRKGTDTFNVYLEDSDEPDELPTKFYDDFMNKLKSYVKSNAQ